jgi:parvulin-like peptidyl-prolyl isomerase
MDTRREGPRLDVAPPASMARAGHGRSRGGWMALLLLLVIALEAVLLWAVLGEHGRRTPQGKAASGPSDSPDLLRAQALRLEEMGVAAEAARAWERYLDSGAGGARDERALVRYRAGKLWQEAGEFGAALAAYVRAEKEGLADEDARKAVGPRVVDCLRALGRYGAIRSELGRRTGGRPEEEDAGPVVASFAGEKLTRARFERIVEAEIETMLEPYAASLDEETLAREKERLAKTYRDPEQAARILKDVVLKELLVRRARELGLDRDEGFREKLGDVENLLLAKTLRDREVEAGLKPTPSDIEGYYAAHREAYRTPERARLAVIEVENEEAGRKLLAGLKTAEDFARAAREASRHEASKEAGGAIETPLTRGEAWSDFGRSADLEAAVFAAESGTILDRPIQVGDRMLLVRVIERLAPTVPPLESVRDRVARDYVRDKRRELLEALTRDLERRYDVRYDFDALRSEPGQPPAGREEKQ